MIEVNSSDRTLTVIHTNLLCPIIWIEQKNRSIMIKLRKSFNIWYFEENVFISSYSLRCILSILWMNRYFYSVIGKFSRLQIVKGAYIFLVFSNVCEQIQWDGKCLFFSLKNDKQRTNILFYWRFNDIIKLLERNSHVNQTSITIRAYYDEKKKNMKK